MQKTQKKLNPSKKNYNDYIIALSSILSVTKISDLPQFVVLYGNSDYLLFQSLKTLKQNWSAYVSGTYDSQILDYELFSKIAESNSIFAQKSIYIIQHAEKKTDLIRLFIESCKSNTNTIIFCFNCSSLPPKISLEFSKHSSCLIPCTEPSWQELPQFILSLGKKFGLQLDQTACELLRESLGSNLNKLENEISKFNLLFPEKCALTKKDILPYLPFLREDHAFEIENHLLQNKKSAALALITDLLYRGESPLALIGVLTSHCRKFLRIHNLIQSGYQLPKISEHTHLPLFVVKNYAKYISSVKQTHCFIRSLRACSEVDIQLKTSRFNPELAISEILMHLPG